jgi:hypothetical protein
VKPVNGGTFADSFQAVSRPTDTFFVYPLVKPVTCKYPLIWHHFTIFPHTSGHVVDYAADTHGVMQTEQWVRGRARTSRPGLDARWPGRRGRLCTEEVGSGDGPLSVRVRPSSPKRDCARRATSSGGKAPADVHAKSRLTLEPLRTLRSETKGQAGACPDRTRAIPCKLRAVTAEVPLSGICAE